jgi:hypothetical protein
MGFSKQVTDDVLIACGRHCCVCHKFCGTKIELHHIIQVSDNGPNTFDNCIPLCFDCHADVKSYNPKHPKGKQFTDSELKRHRDNWYKKVNASKGVNSSGSRFLQQDRMILERVRSLLKDNHLMIFIRNNDFLVSSFPDAIYRQIFAFIRECELSELEFIDSDLEGLKAELLDSFVKLDKCISKYTFPAGPGRQAIPYEWEQRQPARYDEACSEFEKLVKLVWTSYDSLIKLARRKLYADELH